MTLLRRPRPTEPLGPPPLAQQAAARFAQTGMRAWSRPRDEAGAEINPRLPSDLTRLNDAQVGKLWTQFCAMCQWAKGVYALLAVDAAVAKRRDKHTRAEAHVLTDGSRETKAAKIELAVAAEAEALLVAEGAEKLAEACYEGYVVGKEAVSRELTRRVELERSRGSSGTLSGLRPHGGR